MSQVALVGQSSTQPHDADEPATKPADSKPVSEPAAAHATPQGQVDKAVADYKAKPDASTQQQVYSAVASQLDAQMQPVGKCLPKQTPAEQQARISAYGKSILRGTPKDAAAQNVVKGAIAQYQAHNLASLDGHGLTAQQALDSLNKAVQGLPSKTSDSVLKSPAGQKIFQDAVKSVTDPLKSSNSESADPGLLGGTTGAQEGLTKAWNNLASLTASVPPAQAQQLVKASLPAIEKAATTTPATAQMFNDAVSVAAHISNGTAGTPAAQEASTLTAQIAQGYRGLAISSPTTLESSLGSGADPTLALAISKSLPAGSGAQVQVDHAITEGVQDFQGKVKGDIAKYSGDFKQLDWLINNAGPGMTKAQLNQAIKAYTDDPKWSKQVKEDYQQTVKDGTAMLQQLKAMGNSGDPHLTGQVSNILKDSTTQYAIDVAIKSNPRVTSGPGWESTLKFLTGQIQSVKTATDLAQDFASAYIKQNILPSMKDLGSDSKSYQQAIDKVAGEDTQKLLSSMGVSPATANNLITKLKAAMPRADESAAERAENISKLKKEINGITAGSDLKSLAGRMVFGIGAAASAVSVYSDAKSWASNPNALNTAKVFTDGVSIKKQVSEFAKALGLSTPDPEEAPELLSKIMEKEPDINTLVGSVFNVASTIRDVQKGHDADAVFKSLNTAGALLTTDTAKSLLSTLGDDLGLDTLLGDMAGPVGIGIGLGVALGQAIYDSVKSQTQYQNPATTKFLESAGLNPQTAQALTKEADGHSTMPVLAKYAELNGYDLNKPADQKQFAHWLNSLNAGQLRILVGLATNMQYDTGGDPSKLTKGSASEYSNYDQSKYDWYDYMPANDKTTAYWLSIAMGASDIHLPKAPA